MKPEDEEPTEAERREAAALAAALEGDGPAQPSGADTAPADALETAALLRHARAPIAVPPAAEPVLVAQAAPRLDARRAGRLRRARVWIGASLVAPAAAAAWLLFATTASRQAPHAGPVALPAPTADLLAAQAQATRGGSQAGAALARLEREMRAYRRQYHAGLRGRGEGTP
jgi:hypothetical protein